MDDKMIDAVKNWLEAIMPAVVETLVANLTVEALHEIGKEKSVHGPIAVNLEEFRAPINAINFYTIVVEDGMMLATTADIKGAEENTPEIGFDMFFPIAEFAKTVADEEHVQQLVNRVLEQYKNNLKLKNHGRNKELS